MAHRWLGTVDRTMAAIDGLFPDWLFRQRGGQGRATTTRDRHRIAIFNVKYSPNLGDGVIAACLEGELQRADPRLETLSIDLAGRQAFRSDHGRHRKSVLSVLEWLPQSVRRAGVPLLLKPLVRMRYAPRWRRQLRSCSSVIIGGGALFADVDQNFPIKLAQALDLARDQDLPVAVASVGVSGGWSREALGRITPRLSNARLAALSVRDIESAATWKRIFGLQPVGGPTLAPDPGLLSARQFGPPDRTPAAAPRFGLCVTAPLALRLHADHGHDEDLLEAWMRKVATGLADKGCAVELFTNGSPEDRQFRDRLVPWLDSLPGISFAADAQTPQQLARYLGGLDCVLAHRLHACIIAYAYRVPTVGFSWDRKLHSHFAQTERAGFIIDPRETSPMDTVDLAIEARGRGIDAHRHEALLDQAAASIHRLAARLLGDDQPATGPEACPETGLEAGHETGPEAGLENTPETGPETAQADLLKAERR